MLTQEQIKNLTPGDKLLLEVELDRLSDAGHLWVKTTPVDNAYVPTCRVSLPPTQPEYLNEYAKFQLAEILHILSALKRAKQTKWCKNDTTLDQLYKRLHLAWMIASRDACNNLTLNIKK